MRGSELREPISNEWNFDPLHWIDRLDRRATREDDIKALQRTMVRDGVVHRAVPEGPRTWYKWVPEDQIRRKRLNRKYHRTLNLMGWALLIGMIAGAYSWLFRFRTPQDRQPNDDDKT